MGDDPPVAVSTRGVPLAGGHCQLRPPEWGCLPVLWPARQPGGWTDLTKPRAGRIAVYVSMVAPVIYALTRYAYALGIPLGISEEFLRRGQESGMWTAGLFLANFGLVGAVS